MSPERTVKIYGVDWPESLVKEFKAEWVKARRANLEMFMFHEQPVLTAYAEYVVQYAEAKLGKL